VKGGAHADVGKLLRGKVVDAAAIIILDRPEYSLGNPLEIQATVRNLIFMTALAETGNKVKGLVAGAVDYITKPFQREELQARIAVHLHNRELTKRLQEAKELLNTPVEERTGPDHRCSA
jgi:DNA-binding response OmpR family regulator